MKKIIPVLLLCCIQYFVSAQNAQKSASVNVSKASTYSSGNTQAAHVSTSNSNTNHQVKSATPNYNQNTSSGSSNQYVPNNQLYTTSGSKHFRTVANMPVAEKITIVSEFNPVLSKVLFPHQRPAKKIAAKNSNVLFSTVSDSAHVFSGKPITPVLISVAGQNNGTSGAVKTEYVYPKNKPYRYKCIYGNFADNYGPGWYSIHVASFKNLDYCKKAIRYMKTRYKLDVYLFDDLSSVNMRYHLVLGKYRVYFVADNILRYIRKEMPSAFVINWNRYAQMILFQ